MLWCVGLALLIADVMKSDSASRPPQPDGHLDRGHVRLEQARGLQRRRQREDSVWELLPAKTVRLSRRVSEPWRDPVILSISRSFSKE